MTTAKWLIWVPGVVGLMFGTVLCGAPTLMQWMLVGLSVPIYNPFMPLGTVIGMVGSVWWIGKGAEFERKT